MVARNYSSPLLLKLPPELKAWLNEYAQKNSRNMTGQLIEMIKAERRRLQHGPEVHNEDQEKG
ncbi:hypothetical protein [Pseudorhizobium marinum]|uniref:hypothetical protein n=1 Tax=Pseudorhizobium marinum TaxID=1496690 RepID=UPI0012DDD222|nr:hypothetical protein [Pseudorhizobium marinum]